MDTETSGVHPFFQLSESFFMAVPDVPLSGALRKSRSISQGREPSLINRVLLMDDEEMLRKVGAMMLERLGYACETVADGNAAITAYEKAISSGRPFDVVMLDLTNKTGMGGREAVLALKKMDPDVRAIVCSGWSVDPVLENFIDYGFCGALPKPYLKADLERVLAGVICGN